MNESFVRQRLLLHQGEQFRPSAIEAARSDLASIGVFSVVRAEPADALDPEGQLPIKFDLTERPLHSVDLTVAYSTDLGINFTTGWHDRNLFGNAEQLNLTAAVQLGGNAVTKPGYQVGAQFLKPDFLARDQSLEADVNAVKQSLQAYDQTALLEKVALNRKLSPHWTASLGLSGEQESIVQEGQTTHYNLVGIPASLRFDNTTSLLDPTSGVRASISATPTQSLGSSSATFVIMQLAGSTYLDLLNNGRSVVALRGLVGKASGAGVFEPAPGPAVLCRRQRHRAWLPLPDAWPAIPRSNTGRRHGDLDRNRGIPPAYSCQLWRRDVPGRGTGQFERGAFCRRLARRSRGRACATTRRSDRSGPISQCR